MTPTTTDHPTLLDAELRRQGRMSIWLAQQLDVTPATVSRWRRGHVMPAKANRHRIAQALGRTEHDLFRLPAASTVNGTENNRA